VLGTSPLGPGELTMQLTVLLLVVQPMSPSNQPYCGFAVSNVAMYHACPATENGNVIAIVGTDEPLVGYVTVVDGVIR